MLVEQKIAAHSKVENQYRRVVPDAGNLLAQQAIADVFCVNGDSEWRGLGVIESSGVHQIINDSMPKRISARHRSRSAMTRAHVVVKY